MRMRATIFIALLTVAISCGSDENKEPQKFNLTVNNGNGSGEYPAGQVITVSANPEPDGKEFAGWTGDADLLDDASQMIAKLTMPGRDAEITATYEDTELGDPVTLTLDKGVTYQTIDGFGFFGAHDVWWGGAADMWNEDWGEKVITDLGITIWRNEYYPPATANSAQDADWDKQKPVVEGLKAIADAHGVDLKFVFTVWSPPEDLKWQSSFTWPGDENATRSDGSVSTKNGGTLNPDKYNEFADWLKEGIQLYEDAGIQLYAFSPQNEPMFTQTFNSCTYTFQWYNDMLKAVVPLIKADYPDVKIFGSENMLDMEGADINWPWFYHSNLKADQDASDQIDILAVHGYNDGVAPTSGSGLAERWTNHREQFSDPMQKVTWMTETSGYADAWLGSGDIPGALNLGQDIHAGLYYGNISGWIWWQGSELGSIGDYNLMNGTTVGKKYYVSKHFYRYIRPGAVRFKAESSDTENVFVTAYRHDANDTHTLVIINSGTSVKQISVAGDDLPDSFEMYRTTGEDDNCTHIGTVEAGDTFVLPAESIVTLQAGGDPL
jgi:O-glycosyl hydrolase